MSEYGEFHDELRAVARDLLGTVRPGASVEWRLLAESGWLGLEVPAALSGADATFAETAVVLQELGEPQMSRVLVADTYSRPPR